VATETKLLTAKFAKDIREEREEEPPRTWIYRIGTMMTQRKFRRGPDAKPPRGFTLIELIIATALLLILTTMALPLARLTVKREREHELRQDLWMMRDAIDRYKIDADQNKFQIKVDSQGYPPDLETLVKGVDIQGKKVRYLRKVPVDPMTKSTEWGMRSMQDDPDSDSFGGQSVFDVYTKSTDTALDGTKYKDW